MAKQNKQPANDPQLKEEVNDAVAEAEHDAKTGDVATVKESDDQPAEALGHSHPPE